MTNVEAEGRALANTLIAAAKDGDFAGQAGLHGKQTFMLVEAALAGWEDAQGLSLLDHKLPETE